MSFILDALKKSETLRQRHDGPGFATVRSGGSEQAIPIWVPLLGGLLLINAVVLGVLFWPKDKQAIVEQAVAPVVETVVAVSPQPVAPDRSQRVVRSLAREASAGDVSPAARGDELEPMPGGQLGPTPAASGGSVLVMPEAEMDAFIGLPDSAAQPSGGGSVTHVIANRNTGDGILRDFNDLQLNGEINLPDLHLDVHVYTPAGDESFVFINMRKYTEGNTLREGPQLEAITPEGAVLVYNGQRFALSPD